MNFDWRQYFVLAAYMTENAASFPDNEACYRTVVSRAYYACFRVARDYVESIDRRRLDHGQLADHLKRKPQRELRRIGNRLHQLRIERNKADYNAHLDEPASVKAAKTLAMARRVLADLDARR